MMDIRYMVIRDALEHLSTPQINRILDTLQGDMVCDTFAYDASTGRY